MLLFFHLLLSAEFALGRGLFILLRQYCEISIDLRLTEFNCSKQYALMAPQQSVEVDNSPAPRSNFVTVLSWVFIGLSGFGTLMAILQNLMLWLLFPLDKMKATLESGSTSQMPTVAVWIFVHIEFVFLCILSVFVMILVTSIGLQRRKDWARRAFITLMGLGIIFYVVALPVQWLSMEQMPQLDHPKMERFRTFMLVTKVVSGLMVVGFCTLLGWVITRLRSAAVLREFGAES